MTPSAAASSLLAITSEPANTTLVNYAIPFQNPVITPTLPGTYSAATYTYTCTQTGPYLFSVTAAVPRTLFVVLMKVKLTRTLAVLSTRYIMARRSGRVL